MKCSITLLFLLLFSGLQAQSPVLTRANYFELGDSILVYHKSDVSLTGFSPGLSGAGVLWDFSGMDFNHPSVIVDTLLYIDPAGTPFYPATLSADYSLSNLCYLKRTEPYDPANNDYNYYYEDSDSIAFIGHWAATGGAELWEDHCTDMIKELCFPFSYSGHFVDAYSRYYFDMSGSDAHYLSGTNTVTADAYGSLITPDGETLDHVLRIHSVRTVRDSNVLFGITEYSLHQYRWYAADKKGYLLSFDMAYGDSSVIETADYQKQVLVSNTAQPLAGKDAFLIYPNPNNGQFHIVAAKLQQPGRMEIYNVLGRMVYVGVLSNGLHEIDLTHCARGVYTARMIEDGKQRVRKIVIGADK